MKQNISADDIARDLINDEYAGWTRVGAYALATYLDETEPEDAIFDRIAVRCEWAEYPSALAAALAYGFEPDEEEDEEDCEQSALRWIGACTEVLAGDETGGVIVRQF